MGGARHLIGAGQRPGQHRDAGRVVQPGDGQGPHRLRRRQHLDRDPGHGGQRAEGPGQQLRQVVAGDVLDHPAAGSEGLAAAGHRLDPQHMVPRGPGLQPPRPRQVAADGAAQRAGVGRAAIERAEIRRLEGQGLAAGGQRRPRSPPSARARSGRSAPAPPAHRPRSRRGRSRSSACAACTGRPKPRLLPRPASSSGTAPARAQRTISITWSSVSGFSGLGHGLHQREGVGLSLFVVAGLDPAIKGTTRAASTFPGCRGRPGHDGEKTRIRPDPAIRSAADRGSAWRRGGCAPGRVRRSDAGSETPCRDSAARPRRRRISAAAAGRRSSGPNITSIRSRFSTPTPCSPVSTPPTSTHSRRMSEPNASAWSSSPGHVGVVENERMQIAVAGMEDIGDLQAVFLALISRMRASTTRQAAPAGWCRPCSNSRARCGRPPETPPCVRPRSSSRSSSFCG